MRSLVSDLRHAWRVAWRQPRFTAIMAITLSLGIGGTTAVFGVLNAVFFRPLPYGSVDRLHVVWETDPRNGAARVEVSPGAFTDWTTQSRAFSGFVAYFPGTANLTLESEVEQVTVGSVTPAFNDVLQAPVFRGRGFTEADAREQVVLLSHGAWQDRFGGDPSIVGRDVVLNGSPQRVIGIMPPGFFLFDRGIEFWRPHALTPRAASIRNVGLYTVVGRLRDGFSLDQARQEMETLASRVQTTPSAAGGRGTSVVPLREQILGDLRAPLSLLAVAVMIVLLVGCANVANLHLASGASRQREFAVRAAIGAARGQLIRQLLAEGCLYALLGGAIGVCLTWWSSAWLGSMLSRIVPEIEDVRPDWPVFAFGTVLSLVVGLVFATLPAILTTRADLVRGIGAAGRVSVSRSARRAGRSLAIAQVILAVVLVAGASLAVRSLTHARSVDSGIDVEGVLTGKVTLPVSRYFGVAPLAGFFDTLEQRLLAVPGMRSVGVTSTLPFDEVGSFDTLTIEGETPSADGAQRVAIRATSPGYFDAIGVSLVGGRLYAPLDGPNAEPIAVINKSLADLIATRRSPLGARIQLGPRRIWRTVIGIVGDVHHSGPERPVVPEVYVPMAQGAGYTTASVVARVAGDPVTFAPALRTAVSGIDSEVAVASIRPMAQLLDGLLSGRRAATFLLAGLAALALVLSMVGVYGVVSHGFNERLPELAVRVALGASESGVFRMVLWDGLWLACAGLVPGVCLATGIGVVSRSLLFGVAPLDPLTLGATAIVVLAATAAASLAPARRATRLDPLTTMRQ